jgi:hypothetical protein
MSIIIKGMQLPKAEDEFVEICVYGDGIVIKTGESFRCADDKKCYYTPTTLEVFYQAVEIAEGHGRLIDADALETRIKELYCSDCERRKGVKNGKMRMLYAVGDAPCRACGTYDALCDIDDAPTVIEAEE